MSTTIRSFHLANGLTVEIKDHTVNYFGDYYKIQLTISCKIPVNEAHLASFRGRPHFDEIRHKLGAVSEYRREIEKAGVYAKDLESTKSHLMDSFENHALIYFEREDFPELFTKKKFTEIEEELLKEKRQGEDGK